MNGPCHADTYSATIFTEATRIRYEACLEERKFLCNKHQ